MHALQKQVGRRIRELRENKGLSQEALAGICNLHRTYIGLIERGERNLAISTVEVIAAGLEVTVSDIFAELEHPPIAQRRTQKNKSKTSADVIAHIATIRQVLIDAKLVDGKRYDSLYETNRKSDDKRRVG